MPLVAFWSSVDSTQTSTTSIAVAVANAIALKTSYKSLITQTHYRNFDLEASYDNFDKMTSKGNLDIADTGMDALDRLLRSNKLAPENIPNYAKIAMRDRLEVLYGSFKNDKDSYDRVLETMPLIIDYAAQLYDMVFVDLNRGYDKTEINQILQKADLIVLTFSQKTEVLKKLFKSMDELKIFREKPIVPVIGRYDRFSKYNSKNIARAYNYKKNIFCIPYNTQFFDACNEGKSLNFFVENRNADIATDRNGYFISEVNKIADEILSLLASKLNDK